MQASGFMLQASGCNMYDLGFMFLGDCFRIEGL